MAQNGPGTDPGHLDHAHALERTHRSTGAQRAADRRADAPDAPVDGVDRPHEGGAELALGARDVPVVERVHHGARDGRGHLELLSRGDGRSRSVTSTVVGTSISPIQRRAL